MRVAGVFGNDMVMQRDVPMRVWGWAAPGERVTAALGDLSAEAVADADGRWTAVLPASGAGGPYELSVRGRNAAARFRNIMVGDVWFCSGQSNMQFTVDSAADADREIASSDRPAVRLYTVPRVARVKPADDVGGSWSVAGPGTVRSFSAVAWFFGRELSDALDVPIGLIDSSWGGTRIEAWMSRACLSADPTAGRELERYEAFLRDPGDTAAEYEEALARFRDREEAETPRDPGDAGVGRGWAEPGADLSEWGEMTVPQLWQSAGILFNGVLWFRREIAVPEAWAGKDLILRLGPCDKTDITRWNGVEIGRIGRETANCWAVPRAYRVPGRLVRPGGNTVAVRIVSEYYAGGFGGVANDMRLEPADGSAEPLMLAGVWRYRVEHNFGMVVPPAPPPAPFGDGNANSPHILHDSMVAPVTPFPVRGAIWYQGESNTAAPLEYRRLFPAMIADWRAAWGNGAMPFIFVQLANYYPRKAEPSESAWAILREAQTMALRVPKTGMAVAIDIGEAGDIHPKNKQDVGRRLAMEALRVEYGRKIVSSGPLYRAHAVEGDRVRVSFDSVGGGLAASGGRLAGFAVAGVDRRFVWADAVIEGGTVVVRSGEVKEPVAVRYGWADNPDCTLFNREGFPAGPFRTDDW